MGRGFYIPTASVFIRSWIFSLLCKKHLRTLVYQIAIIHFVNANGVNHSIEFPPTKQPTPGPEIQRSEPPPFKNCPAIQFHI